MILFFVELSRGEGAPGSNYCTVVAAACRYEYCQTDTG